MKGEATQGKDTNRYLINQRRYILDFTHTTQLQAYNNEVFTDDVNAINTFVSNRIFITANRNLRQCTQTTKKWKLITQQHTKNGIIVHLSQAFSLCHSEASKNSNSSCYLPSIQEKDLSYSYGSIEIVTRASNAEYVAWIYT